MGIDLASVKPFEICSIRQTTGTSTFRREKLELSMKARGSSFYVKYGGLTRGISERIGPYIKGGVFDFTAASDEDLREGISMVRKMPMPLKGFAR